MRGLTVLPILAALACFPSTALAYIGPALSGGLLILIGAVLFSVLLAVFALVWYPLKRARARRREARAQGADADN